MIAFYGVLFGMVILAIKLLMQEPMKMRFKNIIRRITKREPETESITSDLRVLSPNLLILRFRQKRGVVLGKIIRSLD